MSALSYAGVIFLSFDSDCRTLQLQNNNLSQSFIKIIGLSHEVSQVRSAKEEVRFDER